MVDIARMNLSEGGILIRCAVSTIDAPFGMGVFFRRAEGHRSYRQSELRNQKHSIEGHCRLDWRSEITESTPQFALSFSINARLNREPPFDKNGYFSADCFVLTFDNTIAPAMKPFLSLPLSASITVLFYAISLASEAYWPEWRGPNRDGHVEYFDPPSQWPKSLANDWRIEVGEGSAMPLIAEGSVYQHARQGGDEVVWKIDLESGKVLWRQNYRVPYRISSPGERHGDGPLSNPAYAEGRLFTFSVTGVLSAWNAESGELLWRKDYADRFDITHPHWGHSTSPLVDGEQVIVHFGGDHAGILVAMDVTTGKVIWSDDTDGACHASPIIVELKGIRQIVEWNHNAVVGFESGTGKRLWEYPLQHTGSNQNSPTPVFRKGRLLIGGENRGIRSLEPKLVNGQWEVIENWHQRRASLNMASAVASGDSLYGKSHFKQGQFFRLDIETGDIVWTGPARMGEFASFLVVDEHLIALRDDATIEVIPVGESEYRSIATYEVAESPTWAAPVLLKDGILVKDRRTLFKWSF
jgi:outer membrane protein assembly factor BamB